MDPDRADIPSAPRRILIKVGYACNNNCVFCHSTPHRGREASTQELMAKIEAARGLGAASVVLSGGEPTIREDLLALVDHIVRLNMRPGLVTNARCLANPGWIDALCARGLDYVYLSLCGPDARQHDALVRARAFGQVMDALSRLAGRVRWLTVNVVVQAANLQRLDAFAPLLAPFGPLRLKFSLVEPEGAALDAFERVVPPLSAAARAVRAAVAGLSEAPGELSPAVDGFPLCLLADAEPLEAGLREDGFFAMSEAFEAGFFPVDEGHRGFGRPCLRCSLRRRCRGVFRSYLERRGDAELASVSRPVSNSFQIVVDGPPVDFKVSACPVRAGAWAPPDAVRGLLVQAGRATARRASVDTRDFSDETLRVALRKRGQVYLPDPRAGPVDDFAGQLQRFEPAATCRRCPRRVECGRFWRPNHRPAFQRARGLLTELLRGLRGRVLDVGCGSAPYAQAFESAQAQDRLEYVGIDPALAGPAKEAGWTRLPVGLEDFDGPAGAFDAVISLRSLNHLRDPEAGLRRMAELVRPGGRLLIADDVIFGLLRTGAQADQIAARSDLAFEHRVNLDAREAQELAERVGLECRRLVDTDETGCTLWLLELRG